MLLAATSGGAGAIETGPRLHVLPDHEDGGEYQTARGLSRVVYDEFEFEHHRVRTEHGTIYGVVQRPVVPEGVEVPVILTYSPYNVTNPQLITAPARRGPFRDIDYVASYYAPRGYARAIFDLVGTRNSSGCYDFGGIAERETGAAVVDHLGSQPWSNGRVGMIGGSYDGTTAYAAAIEAPEHLVTIVPQVAIDRWWDYAYHGGVRRDAGSSTPVAFDLGFAMLPPNDVSDPLHWGEAMADSIRPCRRVEHQIRGFGWDPVYDEFWEERDYRALADRVTASVLIEAGWQDFNVSSVGSTRFFQTLPDDHPKKLVIGQWDHSVALFDDSAHVRHAWFDYWLLGYDGTELPDTGVMDLPRVDTHMTAGPRVQQHDWPAADSEPISFPLGSEPADVPGGALVPDGSSATWQTTPPWVTADDAVYGDCDRGCLVFRSAPMPHEIRLTGSPVLDLTVQTTAQVGLNDQVATQLVVVLFVQDQWGRRYRVSPGMLNSRNRDGLDTSTLHPSGHQWSARVELTDIDLLLRKGERLGIAIASDMRGEAWMPDNDLPVVNTLVAGGDNALHIRMLPAP